MIDLRAPDKIGHIKMCAGISAAVSLFLAIFLPAGIAVLYGFNSAMVAGVGKECWDLCGRGMPEWDELLAELPKLA